MGGPGGAIGATFIFISIVLTPLLGTTLTLATLVAGQLSAALVIDHYGLFDSRSPVAVPRRGCGTPIARSCADLVEVSMKDSERQLLGRLRSALLPLHKRLLEWERKTYERSRGQRMTGGELLKVIVGDPYFAWLHPMSALIVRIDETLDTPDPDTTVTFDAIVAQARRLVTPDETSGSYAERYLAALQEVPDVVIAHRDVIAVLKGVPQTLH